MQFIASRNGVTDGAVNGVSGQESITLGQIAQRLLDALSEPTVQEVSTQNAFVLSKSDAKSISLNDLITTVTDNTLLPLDLIQPIIKKWSGSLYHPSKEESYATSHPLQISPRYDYTYEDFSGFYSFFETSLLASKSDILDCVVQADNLTLRQRAFLLSALYLRQQTFPVSGGLYYEGKLGAYFLKDVTLEEFTTEEATLVKDFVAKCEMNVEEIFPKGLSLQPPTR